MPFLLLNQVFICTSDSSKDCSNAYVTILIVFGRVCPSIFLRFKFRACRNNTSIIQR